MKLDHDASAVEKAQSVDAPNARLAELGSVDAGAQLALAEALKRLRHRRRVGLTEHLADNARHLAPRGKPLREKSGDVRHVSSLARGWPAPVVKSTNGMPGEDLLGDREMGDVPSLC